MLCMSKMSNDITQQAITGVQWVTVCRRCQRVDQIHYLRAVSRSHCNVKDVEDIKTEFIIQGV